MYCRLDEQNVINKKYKRKPKDQFFFNIGVHKFSVNNNYVDTRRWLALCHKWGHMLSCVWTQMLTFVLLALEGMVGENLQTRDTRQG